MELSNIEILEVARKRAGYSQKELSSLLGISLPTYGRLIAKGNMDDVLYIHAITLEKLLKVKFSVIESPQGKAVKLTL